MKITDLAWLAYIDPGSGSMLLQMLIAGAVGVIAYFRKYILGFFRRNKEPEPLAKEPETPKADDTSGK